MIDISRPVNVVWGEGGAKRIRIAVSSCLLGQRVRYDGGHKYNGYVIETLGEFFELVPFCPEVAIGLGIPRPPIHLVAVDKNGIRARSVKDGSLDVTEQLVDYAERVVPKLADVSGYILKKDSPSCGMGGVKVYNAKGKPSGNASGLYAGTLMAQLPELPFEEEDLLMNPRTCEKFIERVFVYHRWQQLNARSLKKNPKYHRGK